MTRLHSLAPSFSFKMYKVWFFFSHITQNKNADEKRNYTEKFSKARQLRMEIIFGGLENYSVSSTIILVCWHKLEYDWVTSNFIHNLLLGRKFSISKTFSFLETKVNVPHCYSGRLTRKNS